jgi:hypothetical protein
VCLQLACDQGCPVRNLHNRLTVVASSINITGNDEDIDSIHMGNMAYLLPKSTEICPFFLRNPICAALQLRIDGAAQANRPDGGLGSGRTVDSRR